MRYLIFNAVARSFQHPAARLSLRSPQQIFPVSLRSFYLSGVLNSNNPSDLSSPLPSPRLNAAASIITALERLGTQRSSLVKEAKEAARCEEYASRAQLIVSNLYQIPPNADRFVMTAYDDDGTPRQVLIRFNLKKFRNAKEESDWLFTKARRMRRGSKTITGVLAENEAKRAFLAEALEELTSLELVEGDGGASSAAAALSAVHTIKERVRASKLVDVQFDVAAPRSPSKSKEAPSTKSTQSDNFRQFFGDESEGALEILVGRNRRQNEKLSFVVGKKDDIWLHARGCPGAHVIVKNGLGRSIDDLPSTLQLAANLAIFYSNHRNENKAAVSLAEPKHVLKPKGAPLGTVKLRQELAVILGCPFEVP